MRRAIKTILHSQIPTLPTVPVEVMSAPEAGKLIIVHRAVLISSIVTPYVIPKGFGQAFIGLDYQDGPRATNECADIDDAAINDLTQLFAADNFVKLGVNTQVVPDAPFVYGVVGSIALALNKPLTISMANGGGSPLTGGDAANTLKVVVYFEIL